jgi:hypothetical protein
MESVPLRDPDGPAVGPKTFVLCFDGTGNKFSGDESDSNVLKIFRVRSYISNLTLYPLIRTQSHILLFRKDPLGRKRVGGGNEGRKYKQTGRQTERKKESKQEIEKIGK